MASLAKLPLSSRVSYLWLGVGLGWPDSARALQELQQQARQVPVQQVALWRVSARVRHIYGTDSVISGQ